MIQHPSTVKWINTVKYGNCGNSLNWKWYSNENLKSTVISNDCGDSHKLNVEQKKTHQIV